MVSLGTYGKVIREYEGVGSLTFDDGKDFACSIHVVQLSDGRILAKCSFEEDPDLLLQYYHAGTPISSISGTTDGNEFHVGGQILCMNFTHHMAGVSRTTDALVLASEMTVTSHTEGDPRLAVFGITNFEFIGNRWKEYSTDSGGLDILEVNFGSSKVQIHKLPDYEETMRAVAAQRGIDVTCEAELAICSLAELSQACEVVEDMCRLLSFARGTKINWAYYDCLDQERRNVLSFHKNSLTRPYSSLALIDPRNPDDTAFFVGQVYKPFLSQKKAYDLHLAIDEYLDAKRETVYLNTRALTAVVVAEFLKSRYAERKQLATILSKRDFKDVRSKADDLLAACLKGVPSKYGEPALAEMRRKVGELNRAPFESILRRMCADLELAIDDYDLGKFVKIRNSLVHRATFTDPSTQAAWNEYRFIIGMLDKIFLRLMSYTGYFLDIANSFHRTKIPAD